MIEIVSGFNTKLEDCVSFFEFYSYERIVLRPQEKRAISLPIFRPTIPGRRYAHIELEKSLILNGLQLLWSNLNEWAACKNLELIVWNSNLDAAIINGTQSPLSYIVGSQSRIDVLPNTLLGKIYCN